MDKKNLDYRGEQRRRWDWAGVTGRCGGVRLSTPQLLRGRKLTSNSNTHTKVLLVRLRHLYHLPHRKHLPDSTRDPLRPRSKPVPPAHAAILPVHARRAARRRAPTPRTHHQRRRAAPIQATPSAAALRRRNTDRQALDPLARAVRHLAAWIHAPPARQFPCLDHAHPAAVHARR